MTTTAQVTWVDELQFVGEAGSGHAIVLDGKESAGGHGTGTRPMELLLIALAGCTAMDVVSVLRRKRQQVSGVQVKVEGERAEEHPRVYTTIKLVYVVKGGRRQHRAFAKQVLLGVGNARTIGRAHL